MTDPSPDEFVPLPYFPWDTRPESLPLDVDECATAIFLSNGDHDTAAKLLKVDRRQLKAVIRRSPGLQRLLTRLTATASG